VYLYAPYVFLNKFFLLIKKKKTSLGLCQLTAFQIQLEGGALFCSGILMLRLSLWLHWMKIVHLL